MSVGSIWAVGNVWEFWEAGERRAVERRFADLPYTWGRFADLPCTCRQICPPTLHLQADLPTYPALAGRFAHVPYTLQAEFAHPALAADLLTYPTLAVQVYRPTLSLERVFKHCLPIVSDGLAYI
jgi:hypothetical protein